MVLRGVFFGRINTDIAFVSMMGILVSCYALYVEHRKKTDTSYEAMCDISNRMSCSKVLTSKWSSGFGLFAEDSIFNVPNPIYGIVYFILQAFIALYHGYSSTWQLLSFVLSALGIVNCVYLAYILFVILDDICLVCLATYVINALLFWLNYRRYYV